MYKANLWEMQRTKRSHLEGALMFDYINSWRQRRRTAAISVILSIGRFMPDADYTR